MIISHDSDCNITVSTILSENLNLNFTMITFDFDITLLKDELSWIIIIKNSNFAFSIFSLKSLLVGFVTQGNKEVFIRLPLIAINKINFDCSLFLIFFKCNEFLLCLIVLTSLSSSISSDDPESKFFWKLLFNSNINLYGALSY